MDNRDCTAFLQWALPQRGLRWPGFRKVRRQVCKRLKRRILELGLDDLAAYRRRLEADPAEWCAFDECCHITISRFFRDRGVFEVLRKRVLPDIATRAAQERRAARIWSAGCASGEEPYTLKIIWDCEIARAVPGARVSIVATDVDEAVLARARRGCFELTSLRELPPHLLEDAFERVGSLYCIKPQHREGVEFLHQDVRSEAPALLFDLILCRYVAFTYFAEPLQQRVLSRIVDRLVLHGYLAIGTHEQLPSVEPALRSLTGGAADLQAAQGRQTLSDDARGQLGQRLCSGCGVAALASSSSPPATELPAAQARHAQPVGIDARVAMHAILNALEEKQ